MDTGAVSPFIEFTTERIGFEFEEAELAGSEETVTTGGVDVCYGRVDDGRFGGTADLGKVWEEGGEVLWKKEVRYGKERKGEGERDVRGSDR